MIRYFYHKIEIIRAFMFGCCISIMRTVESSGSCSDYRPYQFPGDYEDVSRKCASHVTGHTY